MITASNVITVVDLDVDIKQVFLWVFFVQLTSRLSGYMMCSQTDSPQPAFHVTVVPGWIHSWPETGRMAAQYFASKPGGKKNRITFGPMDSDGKHIELVSYWPLTSKNKKNTEAFSPFKRSPEMHEEEERD